jgi:hypothetical protein
MQRLCVPIQPSAISLARLPSILISRLSQPDHNFRIGFLYNDEKPFLPLNQFRGDPYPGRNYRDLASRCLQQGMGASFRAACTDEGIETVIEFDHFFLGPPLLLPCSHLEGHTPDSFQSRNNEIFDSPLARMILK